MNHIVLDLDPEIIAAMRVRLDRHLYGRAKTLSPNAAIAAKLAQDSGAPPTRGEVVDAGNPRPVKPAFLDTGSDMPGATADAGSPPSTEPAFSLDRVQLAALRAFRSGMPACDYPIRVFRRLFDLERLGLVEKQDGLYWITARGLDALRAR
jgi:hypothetical protein